jgi:hypothetical protein
VSRRTLGFWAAFSGLVLCGALVLATLRDDLDTAANVAQLVSIPLAAAPLAVALWLWRRKSSSAVTSTHVARAVDVLAVAIRNQWQAEAALRSSHRTPMQIRWRVTSRDRVQAHPATISDRPLVLIDAASRNVAELAAEFRQLTARRLVLIGGPGSGKTTLAVHLLLELLMDRTPSDPVPVLLSAASWDVTTHPDLRTWLVERLRADYPSLRSAELGSDATQAIVDGGHILPVVDGLDEVPAAAQAAMISALNESIPGGALIVTCRTTEFTAAVRGARQFLTSALVMEPESMDGRAAADYIESCRPPDAHPGWNEVLCSLRTYDTPLSAVVGTALGLWLVCEIYLQPRTAPDGSPIPFPDPRPLLDEFTTPAELLDHLLDDFVPAVIARRPPAVGPLRPRKRHDPRNVEAWLGFLATFPRACGRDFTWWRLAYDAGIWPWRRLVIAPAATFILLALLNARTVWSSHTFAVLVAVAVTLSTGLAWLALTYWPGETPMAAHQTTRDRTRLATRAVFCGVVGVVVVYTALSVMGEVVTGPSLGATTPTYLLIPIAAMACVCVPGVILLSRGGTRPSRADVVGTPLQSWLSDRRYQAVRLFAGAFAFGPVIGMGSGLLTASPSLSLAVAVLGMQFVVLEGHHHAWFAYVLAIRRLARRGRLPRNLMYFLDDCHRLGLLRAVGPIYQFRHAALQDRLAEKYLRSQR